MALPPSKADATRGSQWGPLLENPDLDQYITKSARFDNLGELVSGIATGVNLAYRLVQRGDSLRFETGQVTDRSRTVRLDTRHGTLSGYRLAVSAPTATHAIVGAQDVSHDRIFAEVTTPESEIAGTAWGRRIERFVNEAYSDDEDEWRASAREMLASEGATLTSVQALPNDDATMRYGVDWRLGDRVCVVADDREYTSTVTGLVLKVSTDGVRMGMVLGDAAAFNDRYALRRQIDGLRERISQLERTLGL